MKGVLWLLLLSGVVLGIEGFSFNSSLTEIKSDYFLDEFLKSASKLGSVPKLNACQRQMVYILKNWKKLNVFPLVDSWAKIPSGIMKGNIFSFGNYDQCLNINTKLPFPFGTLEGQYCFAGLSLNSFSEEVDESQDFVERVEGRQGLSKGFVSGICIPKICTPEDLKDLPFSISDCKVKGGFPLETLDYVALSIIGVIGLLLLIGTCYDYLFKGQNKNRFLMAFSVPSNAEKLFQCSAEKSKNSIGCLNGMRSLSMLWVIFGHTVATNIGFPKINFVDVFKWSRSHFSAFMATAVISVDSFFFMSGLLLFWVGMKEIEKRKGKINVPLMYLHRYLRLTPMLAFIMLLAMSLYKYLGDGPLWDDGKESVAMNCRERWWMNILYIENYATQHLCLGQSWYLAIDFQLFLVSPLFMYGFWRWGNKVLIGVVALIALAVGGTYAEYYSRGFVGALMTTDPKIFTRLTTVYIFTHTRCPVWLIGMVCGYFLYKTKDKEVRIPWYVQVMGWVFTAGVIYGVTMAPYYTLDGYKWSKSTLEAATYDSFGKIGWGLMMSWVVFACYHGYGGVVNSFLSNPAWQPLARLSFTMYLSHLFIMGVNQRNLHTTQYFSNLGLILQFWGDFGFTLLFSIALVLAIESPIIGIEKILFSRQSKPTEKTIESTVVHEAGSSQEVRSVV